MQIAVLDYERAYERHVLGESVVEGFFAAERHGAAQWPEFQAGRRCVGIAAAEHIAVGLDADAAITRETKDIFAGRIGFEHGIVQVLDIQQLPLGIAQRIGYGQRRYRGAGAGG